MALPHNDNDLFEYTSGRWLVNDKLRHAERRRHFNVDALRRLAAQSVNRKPDDIESLRKLAEGGFNRVFLITMRDGFRMIARIPYSNTVPKYFAVASETATLAFLRSAGVPTPEVYGYSPTPDNAAGTEYIFMQYIEGVSLADVLPGLDEGNIISILRQLVELELSLLMMRFPAVGSLYFAEDLANAAGSPSGPTKPGIPLQTDKRFCIGPETSFPLWYGRRSQLDVDRGPYATFEETLVRGAEKEQAYLRRFGRPLLPLQPARREAYGYQEQQPSDHIENLDRYLRIAPLMVSKDKRLDYFCMRHPDLRPSNIIVARPPDSNQYAIVSIIDWQNTSILPLSLHAAIPTWLQNNDGTDWQPEMPPSLPENLDDMDESQRERELELYRRRFRHYYYIEFTRKYNILNYVPLADPMGSLRRRLFRHSRDLWDGETLELKLLLIQATENWEALAGEGVPCPIAFDSDDARETRKLVEVQREADELLEISRDTIGTAGPEDWVPVEHYEQAMALSKQFKQFALSRVEDDQERAQIAAHWPFDDRDEEDCL